MLTIITSNLRKLARGQTCLVRIPGVCNRDPETVVLAHIRRGHVGGLGMKPHDLIGVHACSSCHDAIDGRRKTDLSPEQMDSVVLEALCRTLDRVSRLC